MRSALTNKTNVTPSRTKSFEKNFFPYCINEWNILTVDVRIAKSIHIFKKIIVTEKNQNFLSFYDPFGVKLFTRVKLKFSHLNGYKFRHGRDDTVSANAEIGDTEYFFLRCYFCSVQRFELFNNINKPFDPFFTQLDTKEQVNILLYSYPSNKSNALSQDIIKFVIIFLKNLVVLINY